MRLFRLFVPEFVNGFSLFIKFIGKILFITLPYYPPVVCSNCSDILSFILDTVNSVSFFLILLDRVHIFKKKFSDKEYTFRHRSACRTPAIRVPDQRKIYRTMQNSGGGRN